MARLSARDLSALLQVVEHLYDDLLDARTLGERVVASLRTLVSGEAVTYGDLNLALASAVPTSAFVTPVPAQECRVQDARYIAPRGR